VWKDWLEVVDEVCVSPKPPSSQNETSQLTLAAFLNNFRDKFSNAYLKVVVFDEADYEYAQKIHHAFPEFDMFLSVGNLDGTLPTVANPTPKYRPNYTDSTTLLLNRTRSLMEKVANDPAMRDVCVFAQQHVLAWGNERGR
jgi:7-carboxy-7-deazaguanine synthase